MSLKIVTPPTAEPVTLLEAKDHLRVDGPDDDAMISVLITAARKWAEEYTGRQFVTATLDWFLDGFCPSFSAPLPPLQSVTSIKYLDTDGAEQTLDAATYRVDAVSEPGRIALDYGKSWPSTYSVINAVTVRFVAGYGTAAAVPEPIRQAILILIGELYEQRQESVPASFAAVPFGVRALLTPYKVWYL